MVSRLQNSMRNFGTWRCFFFVFIMDLGYLQLTCSFSMQAIWFRAKSSNSMLFRLCRFELLLRFFSFFFFFFVVVAIQWILKSLDHMLQQLHFFSHHRFNLLFNSNFFRSFVDFIEVSISALLFGFICFNHRFHHLNL